MEECHATVCAELTYDALLRQDDDVRPGRSGYLLVEVGGASFRVGFELRPNAVWRRGRLFFRCPQCERRSTRLYAPALHSGLRCRRCWGLSYASRGWSYRSTWLLGLWFDPVSHTTTQERRRERYALSRKRYAARRIPCSK